MTIPEGPGGRKVIPHFPDEPERQRSSLNRFGLRSILVAILSVATGFLAMAFLIEPLVHNKALPGPAEQTKTTNDSANQPAAISSGKVQTPSTVVYNGVTVLTPQLLMPAVSTDEPAASPDKSLTTKVAKKQVASRSSANRRMLRAPGSNLPQWVARF
jgi:hypothetical protein